MLCWLYDDVASFGFAVVIVGGEACDWLYILDPGKTEKIFIQYTQSWPGDLIMYL